MVAAFKLESLAGIVGIRKRDAHNTNGDPSDNRE
jgi:hypothetical protein